MITVSLLCTQVSPTLRPSMSYVVAMLLGDTEVITSRPRYLTNWKFNDITSSTSGPSDVKAKETFSMDHEFTTFKKGKSWCVMQVINQMLLSKLMFSKIIKNLGKN